MSSTKTTLSSRTCMEVGSNQTRSLSGTPPSGTIQGHKSCTHSVYTSSEDALRPTIYCYIRSTPISRLCQVCSGGWLHVNGPSSCLQSLLSGVTADQVIYAEEPHGVKVMALVQVGMVCNV